MVVMRHPLQGVFNIIRFNWHFYLIAGVGTIAGLKFAYYLGGPFVLFGWMVAALVISSSTISLIVSWYVYDWADLYAFNWVNLPKQPATIVNIHAGFDETSSILQRRYPEAVLRVFDFYNPEQHTEVSIKRARAAYPAFPGTEQIATDKLPLAPESIDLIFLTLAAHEIRDNLEREAFFESLRLALRPGGRIIVTEHLRDTANFLAYTLGFLHFLSRGTWETTFQAAGLQISHEQKITPFITVFNLISNDPTP